MKIQITKIIALLLLVFLFQTGGIAQRAESVERVSITVSDLQKAVVFYTTLLDFKKTGEYTLSNDQVRQLFGLTDPSLQATVAQLQLGAEKIELMAFVGNSTGRAIPADSRSNDRWFQHIAIVVNDMDKAYQRLRAAKVTYVSSSPQTLPDYIPAAAGIAAFYFRDPDGHNLELIHFPAGKGNPKWQQSNGPLFMGIDHTAIGIADTDQGLDFYKDDLQFQIGGQSENYGTEQEHLNQVFGAHLLITGLHADQGFGVEFLSYIAPPGGRPYPADSRPDDLWHWHTTVKVNGLAPLYEKLQTEGYTLVSNGITNLSDRTKAFMARDSDGHAVLFLEDQPATNADN